MYPEQLRYIKSFMLFHDNTFLDACNVVAKFEKQCQFWFNKIYLNGSVQITVQGGVPMSDDDEKVLKV